MALTILVLVCVWGCATRLFFRSAPVDRRNAITLAASMIAAAILTGTVYTVVAVGWWLCDPSTMMISTSTIQMGAGR